MEQVRNYRHELKFEIPYGDYVAIRKRLKAIMSPDPHVNSDGRYKIRSIYFDNSDDKALREKIDGIGLREKFRIRYYNDDTGFIVLEKKLKNNNLCLKYDARLTEEECQKILHGDTEWMRSHPSDLVKEFYVKMKCHRLKPRVTISYVREPYIYRAGNVRITFDSDIRTSLYDQEFLREKISDISATDAPDFMLMEVKYDKFLPDIIRDIIQTRGLRQQAFSKYGAGRRFG